jgi:hypothetical protein
MKASEVLVQTSVSVGPTHLKIQAQAPSFVRRCGCGLDDEQESSSKRHVLVLSVIMSFQIMEDETYFETQGIYFS